MNKSERIAISVLGVLLLATAVIRPRKQSELPPLPEKLRAVIELNEHPLRRSTLVIGFNYELLQRYAASNKQELELHLCRKGSSYLDSLRSDAIDILVLPYYDSLGIDSVLISSPIDSSSVWLTHPHSEHILSNVNSWIDSLHHSSGFEALRDSYMRRFNVYRSRPRAQLSPYDSIIRVNSDSVGLDWCMLSAVIYKESRFHIEARSPRGAYGLMQMMPSTAARYGVTDSLSPEIHINAGSRHLRDLSRRYKDNSADAEECFKFTLAAYNAGVGRVEDMLQLARKEGVNVAYWDSVKTVLPLMSEELIDTNIVRCGPFKGVETLLYVDEVLSIYKEMKRICQ